MDVVYDPCAGLVVSAPAGNAEQLSNLETALSLWTSVLGVQLSAVDVPGWARVEVAFADAPEAMRGVYDDERGLVFVNSRLKNPASMSITIAHELGHAFGMWHVNGRKSVMNPGNLKTHPTVEDALKVQELWPSCSEAAPPEQLPDDPEH